MKKSKRPVPKSIRLRNAIKAAPLPASMKAALNELSTHINDTNPARRDDWTVWVGTRSIARGTGFARRSIQIAIERAVRMKILVASGNELQRDEKANGRPANCYAIDLARLKQVSAEDVPAHSGSLWNRQQEARLRAKRLLDGLPGSPKGGLPGSPKGGLPGSPQLRSDRLPSEVSLTSNGRGEASPNKEGAAHAAPVAQEQDPVSAQEAAARLRAEVEALLTEGWLTGTDRLETEAWLLSHPSPARDRIPVAGGGD